MANTQAAELLYEQVADQVAGLIQLGTLRPGDRLPSVRRLARQQGVSISTAVQAYLALENKGLCEVRPQSGHYVKRRKVRAPEPEVQRLSLRAHPVTGVDLIRRIVDAIGDPSLVPLGAAVPSPDLLPAEKLNRTLASIARTAGGVGVTYPSPKGLPALRRAVARRSVGAGCAMVADDVVITVGCTEAIHLAVRAVTRPGDAIAVETPTYYGLLTLFQSLDLRVIEIPSHPRSGMDLGELDRVLSNRVVKAVVAAPTLSNPLGSSMSDAKKKRLVAMAERYEVPLVEDDVYGELHESLDRPRPAKAFDRTGNVLLCSSFSKSLAPGYRVGWIAPGRFLDAVERLKFASSLATATLPQMAIAEFLESGGYDHHIRTLRKRVATQVHQLSDVVSRAFPEGTRISRPAGGYVLWVELPPEVDTGPIATAALAAGISVAPGEVFSASQQYRHCLRLSAGYPVIDATVRAVQLLADLIRRQLKC